VHQRYIEICEIYKCKYETHKWLDANRAAAIRLIRKKLDSR